MIITAHNPDVENLEVTYLSDFTSIGATTLYVKNNNNFVTGRPILIGPMGSENSEIVSTSSINANKLSMGVGATVFEHDVDDPVYLLEYNQVRFYRATSETGTYTLQETVALDVDNEDRVTTWDDVSASSTHWYKIAYYNSATTHLSDMSDPILATGANLKSAKKVIDSVVRRVSDPAYSVLGVEEYLDIMNEVNDDLITQTHRPYRFLKTSVLLDTVADQDWVALPTDLWKFDRVEYTRTISGYSQSTPVTMIQMEKWDSRFNAGTALSSDLLTHVAIDESTNRLYLGPRPATSQTGKVQLFYWKYFTEITDLGQLVETPNTLIYRYKMLAEYYSAKSESDNQYARLANNYEAKYGAEVVKMQRVNRLDAGTPREFKGTANRKRYTL